MDLITVADTFVADQEQNIVPKPTADDPNVSFLLFHALRRVKEEGQRVVDGVIDQAMEEWFQSYVKAMSPEDRAEYEAHQKMHRLLKCESVTESNIVIRDLRNAAVEAREEIAYWHAAYLTEDKSNGWKRVDQRLRQAVEAADKHR